MGLLNYTTQISVEKTLMEIQKILINAGALAVLTEFDTEKNVTAISFKIATPFGVIPYILPNNFEGVLKALNNQVSDRKIPRKFYRDEAQSKRVAWRILKNWLEAQLALVECQVATLDQIFLPYAQTKTGQTVYQSMIENRCEQLLLT